MEVHLLTPVASCGQTINLSVVCRI